MLTSFNVTVCSESELDGVIESMDVATRAWTMEAARGECGWVCADCCCTFPEGMPDECVYGDARCTSIIQRDKVLAKEDNQK